MVEKKTGKKSEQGALIGAKLGDYELIELMAAGGMARIYKGRDAGLDRIAAVKVLMRELMETDDTLTERFTREARAIARLDHPNIVPVYQTGVHEGYYFMAMKFIEGNDLAQEIAQLRKRGRLMEVERVLRLLSQVAAALDYAHRHGIIHRDIKPSNVLIDKEDRAILTDFGLALWQSRDKTMGTAFGTPRYISPEQALASEKSVPQSDIYSLAVMLYEILTGDMLFHAENPMQIALSHISDPPPLPRSVNPDIPVAVERELLKALSKAPEQRHATATEFIEAVRAGYGDKLTPARAVSATVPPEVSVKTPVVAPTDAAPPKAATGAPTPIAPASPAPDAAKPPAVVPDERTHPLTPAPTRPRARPRGLYLLSGVMGLVTFAGVLLMVFGSGDRALSLPSLNSFVPLALRGGEPATLIYTFDVLVVSNGSERDLPTQTLTFRRQGNAPASYQPGSAVAGAQCLALVRAGRAFSPADWQCNPRTTPQAVQSDGLFWRQEGGESGFEVLLGDTVIARCPTVPRHAQPAECEIRVPVTDD